MTKLIAEVTGRTRFGTLTTNTEEDCFVADSRFLRLSTTSFLLNLDFYSLYFPPISAVNFNKTKGRRECVLPAMVCEDY